MTAWQNRPLESMYPVVFFDALRVKIRDEGVVRNKAVYLALGVLPDGRRDVLGIWIEQTEGAKFWLKVFNELRSRGVNDILIAVVDRLEGIGRSDRDRLSPHDRADLHRVSDLQQPGIRKLEASQGGSPSAATDLLRRDRRGPAGKLDDFERGEWGEKHPTIAQSWRRAWQHVVPFFAFPPHVVGRASARLRSLVGQASA